MKRCTATSGACTPATIATPSSNYHYDSVVGDSENYWYLIESANGCGAVP